MESELHPFGTCLLGLQSTSSSHIPLWNVPGWLMKDKLNEERAFALIKRLYFQATFPTRKFCILFPRGWRSDWKRIDGTVCFCSTGIYSVIPYFTLKGRCLTLIELYNRMPHNGSLSGLLGNGSHPLLWDAFGDP